MVAGWL